MHGWQKAIFKHALAYNRLMVKISQGTLKEIRDDMFSHMQQLPICCFDTHTHGDMMSHYTNDTDTLRQFISQALPKFISAFVTAAVILAFMAVVTGKGAVTVGMAAAFLNLSKTLCMPISQITQQTSLMAMDLAGAERIFALIDEEPERDEGYVSLVRASFSKGEERKMDDPLRQAGRHG